MKKLSKKIKLLIVAVCLVLAIGGGITTFSIDPPTPPGTIILHNVANIDPPTPPGIAPIKPINF